MLNWGIIGTGSIAYVFCNGMRFTDTGQILAVASLTQSRVDKLVDDFAIARKYTSYEALLADEEIDAVYIATLNPSHAEWVIKAAEAKKHILVEKPIAMNVAEAEAMIQAARDNDVFLMEAFMYRCHPQIGRVIELIQDGTIGKVHLIRATMGFHLDFNPNSRMFNYEMGGGGILDLGCYTASMARRMAGAAENKPFLNPTTVKASGTVGPTGVDHMGVATLQFDNNIVAEIIATIECNVGATVSIYGSKGTITITDPWLPSSPCRHAIEPLPLDTIFPPSKLLLQLGREEPSEMMVPTEKDLFTLEAEMVASHIEARQAPAMSWDDSLGNMQLLDTWRKQIGVVF
ncbi:Gfo/Idh/MocA family oxidoreductase [Chloroflexi bacterium TSY]|nr:Gfo/Idh/MocA family oxidoreductase [Chloroflexi bacterium TSY]